MEINAKFIKEQFKNITQVYDLEWTLEDEYQLKLENKKVRIYFGTERWDDGIMLSLRNKIKNEFYYPSHIRSKMGFENFDTTLTQEEKNTLNGLKEMNDMIVFSWLVCVD